MRPPETVPAEIDIACTLMGGLADTRAARILAEFRAGGLPRDKWLDELAVRLGVLPGRRYERIRVVREAAREALQRTRHAGLGLITATDASYPPLLAQIVDPPAALWTRGQTEALRAPAVAVVGARAATPAGRAIAFDLGRDLARAGLVVVSGMARGVDGAAHLGALDAGGRSIAVLGCGVDVVYPPEHDALAARLIERGAIVSEFVPGAPPRQVHFPRRNRIISGLALAVVVVEASQKSGSLITARLALDQGRDVLAVPGSPTGGCYRGSHALLKDGARLVETVQDVLDEIRWTPPSPVKSPRERAALSAVETAMRAGEACTIEALAERCGRPVMEILAELSALELDGRVRHQPGGHFVRVD